MLEPNFVCHVTCKYATVNIIFYMKYVTFPYLSLNNSP